MKTLPFPLQPHRGRAWASRALTALLLAGLCWLLLASSAMAANFSWSGEGLAAANTWSNGANWTGGTAPAASSSIGVLAFPVLSRSACFAATPTEACETTVNDLAGLSVNELQVDDADQYHLSGNSFTLGSGGLSTTSHAGSGGFAVLALPITLGASQTWSVSGGGDGVSVTGALSGASAALTANLSTGASLALGGFGPSTTDSEVGNVLVQGGGDFWLNGSLNASDGQSVSVQGGQVFTSGATAGALHVQSATTMLGYRASEAAILTTASAVFSGGALDIPITGTGTQAGSDYSQLVSSGTVELTGTTLNVSDNFVGGCPAVPAGQSDTLVSTTGTLSGTFSNAANGSVISTQCMVVKNSVPETVEGEKFRINYNTSGSPQTVTATAVASGGGIPTNSQPPTISGNASEGQTLSESHGSWSNSPTSYAYQWQRCDGFGNNCQAIAGATAQTYTLTSADVTHTIRVQETASNGQGSGTPAVSTPTTVVQAASSGGGQNSGGTTGGGTSSGSGSGSGSGGSSISPEQIKASLVQQLAPTGKGAKIAALVKSGGYTLPFTALEAGTVTVQWYVLPHGARLAKAKGRTKVKPILVASGKLAFAGAGKGQVKLKLTSAGKRLLKHAKGIKLTTKATFTAAGSQSVSVVKSLVLRR